MCCYGLGISRIIQALHEISEGDLPPKIKNNPYLNRTLIWPKLLMPFKLAILPLKGSIYDFELIQTIIESQNKIGADDVLFDDRVSTKLTQKINELRIIGVKWALILGGKGIDLHNLYENETLTIMNFDSHTNFDHHLINEAIRNSVDIVSG